MKYLLLLIFIILLPLSLYAEIDERKIDVYFANGIDTKKEEADEHAKLLQRKIKSSLYNGYIEVFDKQINKVYTAYNRTDGASDIWEFIAQRLNFQDLIDAIFNTDHKKDLKEQVDSYKESINSGHRVLTVAHSQGNLFTAEALSELDTWMQDYFYAVSVASPKAFKIKLDTPHIAFNNDPVAWFGIVFNGIDNPKETEPIETHAFTYYMGKPSEVTRLSTNVAKDAIMHAITGGINNLVGLSSQYNTNLTCNNVVTAKHISSYSGLADIAEVFVVSENGKIFHDGVSYVKHLRETI